MGEASQQSKSGDRRATFWIAVISGDVLALVVGLLTAAFGIAGVIDMAMAHLLIVTAWAVAVIYISLVGYVWPRKYPFKFVLISIVIVSVVLIGANYWMVRKRAQLDVADAQPKLSVDSEPNPMSIIYENKMWRRKISKRARIMVTGMGKKDIGNVKAFVTKVNEVDCRSQLPVSSLDTAFERPNPSPVDGAVTLNPGEPQYFDALVECVAPTCPNGDLAVPHVENGRRLFAVCYEKDVILRPRTLTIKVFGNGGTPVTRIFTVLELGKELLLQSQSEETAK